MREIKYLIIGAGPTGLGAAHRLHEVGEKDFLILEKERFPGGLAASFIDENQFTWDVGGHVVFSHYTYFDKLLEEVLASDYYRHERKAFIRLGQNWVPYPFQNNLRYLPPKQRWECLEGLLRLVPPQTPPKNFAQWIPSTFGEGIAKLFMIPYNEKVWAVPLETMDWHWIGERVSIVDLHRAVKNLALEQDDVGWGPNNTFLFPKRGGTGEIFRRIAQKYHQHIQYEQEVQQINVDQKTVLTVSGEVFKYELLLNTAPLDLVILKMLSRAPENLRNAAAELRHNSVHVVGIGVDEKPEDDKCWMYFPETQYPFYRATNFHNYSPENAARAGKQKALMTEISCSDYRNVCKQNLIYDTEEALVKSHLLKNSMNVVSRWHMRVEYAYPIPTLNRDEALRIIQPWLAERGIYSRGRFGGWKYEVGNMDHSVMQGVEWVNFVVQGMKETTYC